MAEKDQAKPLAPAASYRIRSDSVHDEEAFTAQHKLRQRKYILCCGCITALLLVLAVTILVLVFTVFQIKDPSIKMNAVTFQNLDQVSNNNTSLINSISNGANITFLADVSVKNPNIATFKYNNSTTTLYYRGAVVGEARIPAGKAKARRTLRMNLTVDVVPEKVMAVPSFSSDLGSKALPLSSYTRIGGRVRIMKMIKRFVVVRMNCSMTYNFSSQAIQDEKCHKRIHM